MPASPPDQSYDEMVLARSGFIAAYRAWLAHNPLPTDAALETAGVVSQIRQLHDLWIGEQLKRIEVRR